MHVLVVFAPADMASAPGHYLNAGVFSISLANALIILSMIVLFIVALVVPFPARDGNDSTDGSS